MKKKIIIFGGTSFASQNLIENLKKNFNLINFSRNKIKGIKNYYFDINNFNKKLIKERIKNSEYIFYFTSYVPLNEKKANTSYCFKTNVISFTNLLSVTKKLPKKIILISSNAVYGNNTNKTLKENIPAIPDTIYSISKYLQENILRIFCKKNKINYLCLRLGYVYGKNLNKKRIISKLVHKIKNDEKFSVYNQDNFKFHLIHSKDIAKIICKIFKDANGTYNLANRDSISLRKLIKFIGKSFSKKKINYKNYKKKAEIRNNILSTEKLYKNFKIDSNINYEEGLKDI